MKDIIYSPAKINLALDLLYKRHDGFHEIDTLMLKIDLCDEIIIETSDALEVISPIASGKDNLVYKALKNLESISGKSFSHRIEIRKNIPAGAGLAGGSSNAGTVLRYMGKKYGISMDLVYSAGAMTGSDINFFVSDESFARCTGRGEIIMGLPIPEDMPDDILLIIPPVHASTPEVYREFSIKEKDNSDIDTVLYNLYVKGWEETGNMLFNSLETPAFKLYNKLLELSESMNREKLCCMSGSGASFFVFGPERDIEHDDCEVHRVSIWRENE